MSLVAVALVLAAAAVGLRADRIGVAWTPVDHPHVDGYRVEVRLPQQSPTLSVDLPVTDSSYDATGLRGDCSTSCVAVRSLNASGHAGSPIELCGVPDPEIFDLQRTNAGWRILGDNFAEDVEVYLDGAESPVSANRQSCGAVRINATPSSSVVVRNPADDVRARWVLPSDSYLDDDPVPVVVMQCRVAGSSSSPTVTALSHTPGIGLGVEADAPGVGTDCAAAVAQVLERTGMSSGDVVTIPIADDGSEGLVYLFVD